MLGHIRKMTEITKNFKNWCGNIENKGAIIYYPVDDIELKNLISMARDGGDKIRVVGSSHSASPTICKSNEKVMLLSLHKYHLHDNDITINDDNTVTVNAGWTLGKLYDNLNIGKYYLETQPASSAFTIGGIVTMPIHGGRLGASLIADSMTGITLMDMNGKYISKTDKDEDFDIYRNNLGIFGIITSVTFKIQHIENFHIHINCHSDVFQDDGHVNRSAVESKFKELIMACFEPDVKYHHSFLDFHNNTWTTIDWIATDKKPKIYINTPEINEIKMANVVEEFHKYIVPNYRKNKSYLKMLGKIYMFSIVASIKKNSFEDRDMFWVSTGTRVLFMSYFIPIHTEDEELDMTKLYTALEVVMDTVKKGQAFNVDFPSDIRFVVSSDKSIVSPVYKNKKTVYLAIDLTCSAANINFEKKSTGCQILEFFHADNHDELNDDFRKFFARIEHKWLSLGGIPHFAKMFGFTTSKQNPFDANKIENIFSAETKKILQKNAQPLFVNSFAQKLIT
uniref:FAD-binding PCMH-type domain-containing protein n=1 Tax=viral metagenome TaxID=1070528 RepID=A0A6C0C8I4_9ZZZZ